MTAIIIRRKRILALAAVAAVALLLAACGGPTKGQSIENQQQAADQTQLETNQPIPGFSYSQLRQNAKEIETAEATGVQTTSFFFNLGEPNPIFSCPSIGAPIPASTQLSNPNQVENTGHGRFVIGQMDPSGVYVGDTTGTYVICVGADGKAFADYWEGYVDSVFGPAKWQNGSVVMVGAPSFAFTKGK